MSNQAMPQSPISAERDPSTLELQEKRLALHARLRQYSELVVAYSGGVDSAYLAWEAFQVHGNKMRAVLADSPSLSRTHFDEARTFAAEHQIPLTILHTDEIERPEYLRNDAQRCFYCKDELFNAMTTFCEEHAPGATLAYGRNRDDEKDFRPGHKAAQIHHVAAPLSDAGFGKADVRELAKFMGLAVWDKPASACLASRLEYGQPVTLEALRQVEEAENALHGLGFKQCRVRHHGAIARIEIDPSELNKAFSLAMLKEITTAVRITGFQYVTLDTEGYRSGSMNDLLPLSRITGVQLK
jgi:uncharacterized protein